MYSDNNTFYLFFLIVLTDPKVGLAVCHKVKDRLIMVLQVTAGMLHRRREVKHTRGTLLRSGSVHCKGAATLSVCLKYCCSKWFPWCHTVLCVGAPHAVNVVHTLFSCASSFLLNTTTELLILGAALC